MIEEPREIELEESLNYETEIGLTEQSEEDNKEKEVIEQEKESELEDYTDYDSMALLNNYFVINNIFERVGDESENLAEAESILNDFITMDNFYSVIYATEFFGLRKARELVVKNFIVKQSYKQLKESMEWERLKKNQDMYLEIVDLILTNTLKGNRTIIFWKTIKLYQQTQIFFIF